MTGPAKARIAGALAVLVVLIGAAGLTIGLGRPPAEPVEHEPDVLLEAAQIGDLIMVDEMILATVYDPVIAKTDLVGFDPATGRILGRWPFSPTEVYGQLLHHDGFLYAVSRTVVPDVLTRHAHWLYDGEAPPHQSIVKFDLTEFELVAQFRYPVASRSRVRWIGRHGATAWLWDAVKIWPLELDSSEMAERPRWAPFSPVGSQVSGDQLWGVTLRSFWTMDLATGEFNQSRLLNSFSDGVDRTSGFLFFFHDQPWISGHPWDDPDHVYRYDPGTGAARDPLPRSAVPSRTVESGGYWWDLIGRRPGTPVHVWRQVDISTGEVIEEYRFGCFDVEFVVDDHVWLRSWAIDGPAAVARYRMDTDR